MDRDNITITSAINATVTKELMTKNLFLINLVSLFISAYAYADVGTAKVYIKLFPVGDFVADIKGMKGTVTVTDGNYAVKDLSLDLNTFKSGLELRDNHAKEKYLDEQLKQADEDSKKLDDEINKGRQP